MALHRRGPEHQSAAALDINPVYVREQDCEIPKFRLAQRGEDPRTALQGVRDELILDGNGRPNLVMGTNVQVCWEKFCRYWDVEPRYVPMRPGRLHLRGPQAAGQCDENTIGVVAIMGSTMDGSYEPVLEISGALDELQAAR